MDNKKIVPISLRSSLAPTPQQPPRYRVQVKVKGEELMFADPSATRALVALMDMQSVLGGAASHWGGPSAFAELMAATWGLAFHEAQKRAKSWHDLFHIINDGGHCENGLYALWANYGHAGLSLESLKGFRSIQSKLTGHGESHLFPEAVYLSNGPLGSALPQAQGLCHADFLAGVSRTTITAITDGGCMEGEAREALAAIPGLAAKGKMNPFVLIISDNNTKLSGRIDQDAFSMGLTFASLASLGWHVLPLEQGNDLGSCVRTIEEALELAAKNPLKPVAVHAKTIKGFGIEKTAKSASGGHGFPLKEPKELRAFLQEIYQGGKIPTEFSKWCSDLENEGEQAAQAKAQKPPATGVKKEKAQVGISAAMIRKRTEGLPVISISADLAGSTGVAEFQKKFPECTQDLGVAEANMISHAAGLSKKGFIPIVDTFAQFGVTKGALPLTMAALSEAPVICVFSHVGFQDAADGASHQALSYFAQVGAIPHTDVYALTCSEEADALMGEAIDTFHRLRKAGQVPRNQVFFLGREDFPRSYVAEGHSYKLGRAQEVVNNSNLANPTCIVAGGALLGEAIAAAELLKARSKGAVVINPSIINNPDVATLRGAVERCGGRLVTVEDHQVRGGLGAQVSHALLSQGVSLKLRSLGVRDEFGQSAYKAKELYHKHGLDAEAIVKACSELN